VRRHYQDGSSKSVKCLAHESAVEFTVEVTRRPPSQPFLEPSVDRMIEGVKEVVGVIDEALSKQRSGEP
jgi:hypothetical protein